VLYLFLSAVPDEETIKLGGIFTGVFID